MEQKRNVSIDIGRAIAAYSVITLHIGIPTLTSYFNALARFAIPYFFMISGYFAHSGSVKQRIKKLFFLYLGAEAVYFIYYLFNGLYDRLQVETRDIIELLFYNTPLFYGPAWFLLSMIYIYLIIDVTQKLKFRKILYLLIPVLILWLWLWQRLQTLTDISFRRGDFKILVAIPFFGVGYLIKDKETLLFDKISNIALKLLMGIGIVLTIAERMILNLFTSDIYELYIGTVIFVVALFIYVCRNPIVNMPFLSYVGKNLSEYIYIFHMMVYMIMYKWVGRPDTICLWASITVVSWGIYHAKKWTKNGINSFLKKNNGGCENGGNCY